MVHSWNKPLSARLSAALDEWRIALGDDRISSLPSGNTLGLHREVPATLRVRNRAEVSRAVEIAARHRIPLYPTSTGKNWGYGSACPITDGNVVLDLSAMRRILAFDAELGLVTVEPGVTQQDLADYLDSHGHNFMVPVTGAGPHASLVGNALERGYGITPHADHFAAVTRISAVLPDGSFYVSALSSAKAPLADTAFKWGVGPYLDGLFTQGNFGIVTDVTLALASRPERVEGFFCFVQNDKDLEEITLAVQKILRVTGGIASINVLNARRVLAMLAKYPAQECIDGILPDSVVRELSRQHQVTPWLVTGALYGDSGIVASARKIMRARLKKFCSRILFITPPTADLLNRCAQKIPFLKHSRTAHALDRLCQTLRNFSGRPSNIALPLCYWRGIQMRGKTMDPDADGCGLIWYSPLVTMKPNLVRAYVQMVEETCREFQIEPLITLTALSERCFDSTVPLLFDRTNADEHNRAHRCYDALFERGRALGVLPYRLGVNSMHKMIDESHPYWRLVAQLKLAVDPHGILAPGRYSTPPLNNPAPQMESPAVLHDCASAL